MAKNSVEGSGPACRQTSPEATDLPLTKLYVRVGLTALAMFLIMTVYQAIKYFLNPEISLLQSNAITVAFSTVAAALISFFCLRRFSVLNAQAKESIRLLMQADTELRNSRNQLETQVAMRTAELREAKEKLEAEIKEQKKTQEILQDFAQRLQERAREQSVLYSASERRKIPRSLNQIVQDTVELIPQIWAHPEKICSRILLGEHNFCTANFRETEWMLDNPIISQGKEIGVVEAYCLTGEFDCKERGFLKEKFGVLNAVAQYLSNAVERKRAEESLRISEEKFYKAFQASPVLVAISSKVDVRFMEVNNSFTKNLRYAPLDIVGRTLGEADLLPIAEEKQRLAALFSGPAGFREEKTTVRSKEGDLHTVLWSAEPIEIGGGSCLIHVLQDITEAERADEELIESDIRYRELFNRMSSGVAVFEKNATNGDFALKDINKAGEKITQKSDLAGQIIRQTVPDLEELGLAKVFQQVWRTGRALHHPIYQYKEERLVFWLESYIYKLPTGEIVVVFDDVTELKRSAHAKSQLEARLRQAQKMEAMGTLAGGIAHDFNNILQAILGYAELALLKLPPKDPTKHYVEQIFKAAQRARNLVTQILAFSHQTEQEFKPLKIEPVLHEAVGLLRAALPANINIKLNIEPEAGTVKADPTQVHQIIMNLCTNAAHAMREKGGLLKLGLTQVKIDQSAAPRITDLKPGSYMQLSVRDTGHGMSREILERIFDPFFTTKARGEGTGLGLSVVHGIVRVHGGAITAYSELGKGSQFHVYLPMISDESEYELTEREAPTGSEVILFVDDEEALVEMGKDLLEGLGYQVVARACGLEALEAFKAQPHKFDLVITDLNMPHITGLELARNLKQINKEVRVILCSGFSQTLTADQAEAAGIKEVIMKPLVRSQLATAIRRSLQG